MTTQQRIANIEQLQWAIDDLSTKILEEETAYQATLDTIEAIPKETQEEMTKRGSSSRRRRGQAEALGTDDLMSDYRDHLFKLRETLSDQLHKLNDLQQQKRNLERELQQEMQRERRSRRG
uniref:Uncharacterized protein n=1 Tax=Photinus pyralis TaxID=7054 RepID=A0A1Y1NH14_PHOPY